MTFHKYLLWWYSVSFFQCAVSWSWLS